MAEAGRPVLRVKNLHKRFDDLVAVRGVSFTVQRGETLGIVGESGCGKSTLARLIMGLEKPDDGEIFLQERDQDHWFMRDMQGYRRRIQYVFQDPIMSLNPRKTVAQLLELPLQNMSKLNREQRAARVRELMQLVNLRPEFLNRYPHEFSGGQCQRIGIARALATEPEILVLDEPVSALDVSVQAQILNLLKELQQRLGLTYLFISHDLAVIEILCDRVLVMYQGAVVEQGPRAQIFGTPQHDYTKKLLASVPRLTVPV
ncbi:MAG: ATP-binding cassette domain-containing protein [Gammaproteobacteria bacterium]